MHGRTYLTYAEYHRETATGTVAFMEIENVEECNEGHISNHMAMYCKLNGYVPPGRHDKVFTGREMKFQS